MESSNCKLYFLDNIKRSYPISFKLCNCMSITYTVKMLNITFLNCIVCGVYSITKGDHFILFWTEQKINIYMVLDSVLSEIFQTLYNINDNH